MLTQLQNHIVSIQQRFDANILANINKYTELFSQNLPTHST